MIPDGLREFAEDLGRNPLRTALTAGSVAWGIFMLVLLLGFGAGLQNQVEWQFRDDATNAIWMYRGKTSRPWQGHAVGRPIRFDNADLEAVKALPGVEHISGRYYLWGDFTVSWGGNHGAFEVRACHPDHRFLEKTIITAGRWLDDLDIAEKRKVAVIGEEVVTQLFKGKAEPVGQYLDLGGIPYLVVGVFTDEGGLGELRKIYVPITTAQATYGGGQQIHQMMFTVGDLTLEQSQALGDKVKALMAERENFDPADPKAMRLRNNLEDFQRFQKIFGFVRLFVWLVGIGTVTAGIVGVSNIMLVAVRERTAEIGVRKALGATPSAIVGMVLQEAVALTSIAGYFGLVAGVAVLEVVDRLVPENDYVRHPEVDLGVAAWAIVLLVVAGAGAGFFPAWRAANVHPVEALKDA